MHIYLTARALKQLQAIQATNPSLQQALIKVLDKLLHQQQDAGIYIKKLHGTGHAYFEARINSGDRLLYVQKGDEIFVQYVYVVHDEVNRKARLSDISLEGQAFEGNETPVQDIPVTQYPRYFSPHFEKLHLIDVAEIERLYQSTGDLDLQCTLIEQQVVALKKPLPLFISGGAGSGKTTIVVYRLLEEALSSVQTGIDKRILYIAENKKLVHEMKTHYQKLCAYRAQEPALLQMVHFMTYEDLLPTTEKWLSYPLFEYHFAIFCRGNHFYHQQSKAIYAQLMTILSQQNVKNEVDLQDDALWPAMKWYLALKKQQQLKDISDLTDTAIVLPPFDFIAIDEVQDLFIQQITFVAKHCREHTGLPLLLVGDDQQKLQPTDFSWGAVKQFYKQQHIHYEAIELAYNYRNPQPIAELSANLGKWVRSFGLKDYTIKQATAVSYGEAPIYLQGDELTMMEHFSSQSTILVPSKEQEQLLKGYCQAFNLPMPFILLPEEAKGLEFSEVWLWNFASAHKTMLAKLQRQPDAAIDYKADILALAKELYVSTTRTLHDLYIVEEDFSQFWLHEALKPLQVKAIEEMSQQIMTRRQKDPTAYDATYWAQKAHHFFYTGHYQRFLECIERCERFGPLSQALMRKVYKVQALHSIEQGDIEQAVACYERGRYEQELLMLLEDVKDYARICTYLQNKPQKVQLYTFYRAKDFEQQKNWLAAARCYIAAETYTQAFNMLEKAKQYTELYHLITQLVHNRTIPEEILDRALTYAHTWSMEQLVIALLICKGGLVHETAIISQAISTD